MSWSPVGDRIAYFARKEKQKEVVLQNVLTRKIEKRFVIKSVDMAESPDISPDGKMAGVRRPAQRHRGHLHARPRERRHQERDQRRLRRLRSDVDARRQVGLVYLARVSGNDKLFRLDLATGKKTAAHLRHARRRRRAVHGRRHAGVPVDGGGPEPADQPEVAAQRQHLQRVDAEPQDQRAEAVTRCARRQRVAGRPARRAARREDRLRHLLQGRVRHPHRAGAEGSAAHGGDGRLRRARTDHRLPAAAAATRS